MTRLETISARKTEGAVPMAMPAIEHANNNSGDRRGDPAEALQVRVIKNSIPEHQAWAGQKSAHNYDSNPREFLHAATDEKKTIILPAIRREFERVVKLGGFDRRQDRVIDIGCGPFIMGLPFIRDGINIDGVDVSAGMVNAASDQLKQTHFAREVQVTQSEFTDYEQLERLGGYKFGMMNFVHQCCPDRQSLEQLFKMAASMMSSGGTLVVTGAHPKYLNHKEGHAYYKYDVKEPLNEGDKFGGIIFDSNGQSSYRLHGDTFWKIKSLIKAAGDAGFVSDLADLTIRDLDDQESMARPSSQLPAYIAITFEKA